MTDRASGAPVAEVQELTVKYGRTTAVDDVSLAVPPGKVYSLLGRNGAGKSSLVGCLLGHRRPHTGEARLQGRSAWRERGRLLRRVGVVPETADAPPSMTAIDLERFSARLYPAWDGASYAERLERLEVPPAVPIGRLSKGQRKQVMLGLALACRPRLLVLDDPTLGLDAVARRAIFDELIDELAERGTTVFLTTHDLAGVEKLTDRVGILDGGRLVLDEPFEALRGRFRRIEARGVEAEALAAASSLEHLGPRSVAARSWGAEAVVERFEPAKVEPLRAELGGQPVEISALTLEEIFVAATTERPGAGS